MPQTGFLKTLAMANRLNEFGLTAKQEAFAQCLARGETLSDAYRQSYRVTGAASTVHVSASRLASKPRVKLRVEALLKQVEMAMHRDSVAIRRHVFAGLLKESRNELARPSERISALIALGKIDVVSMFREARVAEGKEERPPQEVEAELRDKLRDLFRENAV